MLLYLNKDVKDKPMTLGDRIRALLPPGVDVRPRLGDEDLARQVVSAVDALDYELGVKKVEANKRGGLLHITILYWGKPTLTWLTLAVDKVKEQENNVWLTEQLTKAALDT